MSNIFVDSSPQGIPFTIEPSEVNVVIDENYVYGGYLGAFTPQPPHADDNPQRAIRVSWPHLPGAEFVFWHEASYCPFWVLPNGYALNYQFAEGPGDVFNDYGRMNANSFADVVSVSASMVHVLWRYKSCYVNRASADFYGTEDWFFYANGLIERTLRAVNPHNHYEAMVMNPRGQFVWDGIQGTSLVKTVARILNLASTGHIDIVWQHDGEPFKEPPDSNIHVKSYGHWNSYSKVAHRFYLKDYHPFAVYSSKTWNGYPGDSIVWGIDFGDNIRTYSHWPIGWINSTGVRATLAQIQTYPTHSPVIGVNNPGGSIYTFLFGLVTPDFSDADLRQLANDWLSTF